MTKLACAVYTQSVSAQRRLVKALYGAHNAASKGKDMDQTTHLEFDSGSSSNHAEAEGRHVNSPITFPKDEKLILCETGELGKKTQQGLIIILGNLKEPHVKS